MFFQRCIISPKGFTGGASLRQHDEVKPVFSEHFHDINEFLKVRWFDDKRIDS
jgi:hypothetical protein